MSEAAERRRQEHERWQTAIWLASRLVVTLALLSIAMLGNLAPGTASALLGAVTGYWLREGEHSAEQRAHKRALRQLRGTAPLTASDPTPPAHV